MPETLGSVSICLDCGRESFFEHKCSGSVLEDKLELRAADQDRHRALLRGQIKLLVALTQRLICLMERVCGKIMVK